MSRPGFAQGLGPSPWEYFLCSLWLIVVIVSMIAMLKVPAFNLLFWPTLWTYDLWRVNRSIVLPEGFSTVRARPSHTLWDRELDGQ